MVHQTYDVFVESEHVILGNDALLKCKIPSYVTDFVSVLEWVDESEISLNALTQGKNLNRSNDFLSSKKYGICKHTKHSFKE